MSQSDVDVTYGAIDQNDRAVIEILYMINY